jgi:hypothetical protein
MEFTPNDAVLVAIGSLFASLLAWLRAGRSEKATTKLEREKVDILRRIAGLYKVQEQTTGDTSTAARALAGRLLSQLLTLPYPQPNDRVIREAALWADADLERLESLAATQSDQAASVAAVAVPALQCIATIVARIQEINPGLGYDYRKFPQQRWESSFESARQSLQALSNPDGGDAREAQVDVHLTGERIYIDNLGGSTARDVQLEIDLGESQDRSPLVRGDVDRKLPIPELRPGDTCPLIAALSSGCYPPFNATLSWVDDSCAAGERRELKKILYGD